MFGSPIRPFSSKNSVVTTWVSREQAQRDPKPSGYPVAPSCPMPMGVLSQNYFVSMEILPSVDNKAIPTIPKKRGFGEYVHEYSKSTGRFQTFGNGKTLVGTGVLVGDEIYTSRHFFEARKKYGIQGQVIFSISNPKKKMTENYEVVSFSKDLNGLDIVRVNLKKRPDSDVCRAMPVMVSQPVGRHAVFHHAGGLACQVSTGSIVDFNTNYVRVGTQSIVVEAGPGASGAGVFNAEGELIGILTFRTTRYGKIARDMVLLSQSSFFNSQPMYVPSIGSSVRPHSFGQLPGSVVKEWSSSLYSSGFEVFKTANDLKDLTAARVEQLLDQGKISYYLYSQWEEEYGPTGPKVYEPGFTKNSYIVGHNYGDFNVFIDSHQGKHSANWRILYSGGKGDSFPPGFPEEGTIQVAREIVKSILYRPPCDRLIDSNEKIIRLSADKFSKSLMALGGSPVGIAVYYHWSAENNGYVMHFYPLYRKG
eukprot:COSAG01_NODE_621_length_14780_cov_1056.278591_11_plen_478_part_00